MLKLNVIIVSYDRKDYTKKCIDSFNAVRPSSCEVLVFDNGSTDGGREYLCRNANDKKIKCHFSDKNLYAGGALHKACTLFEPSDYVLILDNDAYFRPENKKWFEECETVFNSDPKIMTIGLYNVPERGTYFNGRVDAGYEDRWKVKGVEIFETKNFAGFTIYKYEAYMKVFKNRNSRWVQDYPNRMLMAQGYKTVRITPGHIEDQSEYDFDNEKHMDYHQNFWGKHKKNLAMLNKKIERSKKFKEQNGGKPHV